MFINETGFIGGLLNSITINITGSLFLTLVLILLLCMVIPFLFRVPLEFSMIYTLPLFLLFMAYTSEFLAIGGLILIYLAILSAKNFFLK